MAEKTYEVLQSFKPGADEATIPGGEGETVQMDEEEAQVYVDCATLAPLKPVKTPKTPKRVKESGSKKQDEEQDDDSRVRGQSQVNPPVRSEQINAATPPGETPAATPNPRKTPARKGAKE